MKFNYQARTKDGQLQAGLVEAASKEAALNLLHKSDLYITFLEGAEKTAFFETKITLFNRISSKDLVVFSRELSILFKSKVPLLEALNTLGLQVKKSFWREKILEISKDVEGGTIFSGALSKHPKNFSPFFIAMVKSGEASGKLSEVLSYLANHLERDYHLKSKIKGAMIYPAMIIVTVIVVLFMATVFIVPNLVEVVESMDSELPLITKIVITFSEFIQKWVLAIIAVTGVLALIVFRYSKTETGRKVIDKTILKVPFLGNLLKTIYISRFSENFSTLTGSGISITKSLDIIADIVGNEVYKELILEAKSEIQKGESISGFFKKHPKYFTPMFNQMLSVGEKTGTLDKTLLNVVDFYKREVDGAVEGFLKLLEPFLIIFLAVIVGLLMGSLLLPLYSMTTF